MAFAVPSRSGIGLDAEQWIMADGNTTRNWENAADLVSQSELRLSWSASTDSDEWFAAAAGSLAAFREEVDRRFGQASLQAGWEHAFGDSGPLVSLQGLVDRRFNRSEYAEADHRGGSGEASVRFGLAAAGHLFVRGSYRSRTYRSLPEFNFHEARCSLQINRYFRTKTTLLGRIEAAFKRYLEPMVSERVVEIRIPNTPRGKKQQKWRKKQGDPTPSTVERTIRTETPAARISQVAVSVRIAQALSASTGLSVQALARRNPSGTGRYLTFEASGYADDDLLFDDPFNYESEEFSIECTRKLPWSIQGKAGWEGAWKRYDRPALDWNGEPVGGLRRTDRRSLAWISLVKPVEIPGLGRAVSVAFSATFFSNRSNDPYYHCTDAIYGVGVLWGE
jgi:hypothetical protein